MTKLNCWEFNNCGREPCGQHTSTMGVCPAASLTEVDGLNFGQNGGRACWAIAGTFCQGQVQGTFALKMDTCLKCVFYQRVKQEEGPQFLDVEEILKVIYAYC